MSGRVRPHVLSMVLAGGEGNRLMPLTKDRAKPAVPFGGHYRLIDFALSNLANGGYRRIVVLTQYKSDSLNRHLSMTWRMSTLLGNYVTSVPAQMRMGERWFLGSARQCPSSLAPVRCAVRSAIPPLQPPGSLHNANPRNQPQKRFRSEGERPDLNRRPPGPQPGALTD